MAVLIQKYGGSSLADPPAVRRCARRAADAHRDGADLVVVVSAMGQTTNDLISRAHAVTNDPAGTPEMDLLLATGEQASAALMTLAIRALGVEAVALTGEALGIRTDHTPGRARVQSVDTRVIRHHLDQGQIVVVPGFQGQSGGGQTTTLGRGGSDITAVALAAALGGDDEPCPCEILTDVEGVHTADPNLVPAARKIGSIGSETMIELAAAGATIVNARAVAIAHDHDVPIRVRRSQGDEQGTLIGGHLTALDDRSVVGCALLPDVARVSVRWPAVGRPGDAHDARGECILGHLAQAGVELHEIRALDERAGARGLTLLVESSALLPLERALQHADEDSDRLDISIERDLAQVSVVVAGAAVGEWPAIGASILRALARAGIPVTDVSGSGRRVSCLLPAAHGERGVQVIHAALGLETGEAGASPIIEVMPATRSALQSEGDRGGSRRPPSGIHDSRPAEMRR